METVITDKKFVSYFMSLRIAPDKKKQERICSVCNKPFMSYKSNQVTCSKECSDERTRLNRQKERDNRIDAICLVCGRTFKAKKHATNKPVAKTCSVSCRQKIRPSNLMNPILYKAPALSVVIKP